MAKDILITGSSTGFGHEAAKRFADKGHRVWATMRRPEGRAEAQALESYAEERELDLHVLEMDVTSDDSVRFAMESVDSVDVLINNAGLGYGGAVESFTPQEILDQLDLNVVGTARVAQAVLPLMRARGEGLIIQVSSTAGRAAFPGFGVYHASKWGLEGMSEAMRYELAPLGIDVAIVEPGPFNTSFFDNLVSGSRAAHTAGTYGHVADFFAGFQGMVGQAFEDEPQATDPATVVDIFEQLVEMPRGQRPLRTIAGLDFGLQAVNDATDPIRRQTLEMMQITHWDGAGAPEA